jgi:hypothetical protein
MIRSRSRRLSTVAVTAGAVGLMACLLAGSAQAFHIPGATYSSAVGNIRGSFTVSPDGSGITSVHGENLPGNTCTFITVDRTYTTPLPIINHAFNDTSPSFTFRGSFQAKQSAQGVIRVRSTGGPVPCDTGELPFNATTTASAAGSEECKSAQAAVDAAEQKVKKAKKKVKKADDEQEKKKAKKKLRKAKQELQAAQAQAAAVCR